MERAYLFWLRRSSWSLSYAFS